LATLSSALAAPTDYRAATYGSSLEVSIGQVTTKNDRSSLATIDQIEAFIIVQSAAQANSGAKATGAADENGNVAQVIDATNANATRILQTGFFNSAFIVQNGSANLAVTEQISNGNFSFVSQVGTNSIVFVHQG
jgi:hypothetical protein